MMYVNFVAGNKEYKLRLTTRDVVSLERQIGCNPLAIFGNGDVIPTLTTMVHVLHASLQSLQHGITLTDSYEIFDSYLADGNTMTDFIQVIVEIYKQSGLIKNVGAETEKN